MSGSPSDELITIGAAVTLLQESYPEITHSSLRFLEREGLLTSSRTEGGHRLFARADIDRVLLIKEWQRKGLSLDQIRELLEARNRLLVPREISREFLELALASQMEDATQLVLQADKVGMNPETTFYEVLQPALIRLGEKWVEGSATVHQEKEMSVLCRELVTEITLRHSPDFPNGTLFISACVAGERHEIGLCMVSGLLRQRGHRVRYLGPDVATPFLIEAIEAHHPAAVLLTSTIEESFGGCIDAVSAVYENWPGDRAPIVIVGGEMAAHRAQELVDLGALPVRDIRQMLRFDKLLAPTI